MTKSVNPHCRVGLQILATSESLLVILYDVKLNDDHINTAQLGLIYHHQSLNAS